MNKDTVFSLLIALAFLVLALVLVGALASVSV